ncbi:Extra-large guanine nucleotide-binding protein 1 [Bienertia sinuspersici]
MAGTVKKMMPSSRSRSMTGNEFVDLNTDVSIALEYTGSPVNNSMLLKVSPVDIDSVPTANIAASPAILYNLSLPVVQPLAKTNFRAIDNEARFSHAENGVFKDGVDSSGTLGFSDSSQDDHSHELSESSDMLDTPVDCYEIQDAMHSDKLSDGSTSQQYGGTFCEEEEVSDDEHLQCRRKKKGAVVTFCDHDSDVVVSQEESVYSGEGFMPERERPVPERPPKKGMCYHCHRGNRLTEKEACLVCDAKYCRHCIRKAMGSMPEGRKCLTCIGLVVEESKRKMLGKSSRILRVCLKEEEVRQVMKAELSCQSNQLPPESILVNGSQLCLKELMLLLSCSKPPRNLKPGSYWYDRVSGLWGKEGHKPSQIITPELNVGNQRIMLKASNGNTNVMINGREITKAEEFVLKSAGVDCEGHPNFWLQADGSYVLEGMKNEMRNIWSRKRTKLLCALLSLPTPESPNPRRKSDHFAEGALSSYLEQKALCKVLLAGIECSGTSTIYKQARVIYDIPFSKEERQNIKFMIQSNLYGYLGRLLEGCEMFEEESLLQMKKQSTDPGPSDSVSELPGMTKYSVGKKVKVFSDWLIDAIVSSNPDINFPAASPEFASCVEELWNDAAIQATYSRLDELELPRVARYFLDRAVEIAKEDYEPSDTDIMYAEGLTSSNGLASMEFSFPQTQDDGCRNPNDQPDPVTRYQLIRAHPRSIGQNCKWLEMFEDVKIVLFCVSLADYDEYDEDGNGLHTNKMLQSKKLFESIITHPEYKDKNFLLILNKFDLLEEKIEQVPLTRCEWFEDFNPVFSRHQSTRRSGNSIAPLAQRAFHYIGVRFKRLFKSLTGRKLYVCPVTALESDTVDTALRYATEILKWDEDKLNYSSINEFSTESIDNSSYS